MSTTASTARRPGQPLLSLTIPTYNRAALLAELLECLLPQFAALPAGTAELLISDNASPDTTPAVVAAFQQRGLACRYVRNPENLGADGNFLQCLDLAAGQYVWVMGDDDLLLPGSLNTLVSLLQQQEVDLVYLSSFGFTDQSGLGQQVLDGTVPASLTADKLGRCAELVIGGDYFLNKVNALIGLISAMLVNKNRLLATPHPPVETLKDSNLLQLGWLFPLVHRRMTVLYLWQRLLAYRSYNSSGWGVSEVFGVRLQAISTRYFAAEPALSRALMNGVLRYWMCDKVAAIRTGRENQALTPEDFDHILRPVFRRNWRFWIFVYPLAVLPPSLVDPLHRLLNAINRLSRIVEGLLRHTFRHGRYLQPTSTENSSR